MLSSSALPAAIGALVAHCTCSQASPRASNLGVAAGGSRRAWAQRQSPVHPRRWRQEVRSGVASSEQQAVHQSALQMAPSGPKSLIAFLASVQADVDLVILLMQVSSAVKQIAKTTARMGIEALNVGELGKSQNESGDTQKPLDIVANEIFFEALAQSGRVAVAASEENRAAVVLSPSSGKYCCVFDPLDGSRNIDAGIPTGTIFGIYPHSSPSPPSTSSPSSVPGEPYLTAAQAEAAVLLPGRRQVCSGYALYSSATMLVITLGAGVFGFTLDASIGDFVLTHPNLTMPNRGQIYSVNDARYFDWPAGLQRYIDAVRQGKGQTGKKYSARYICSLVADFHRTLLYGGVAMNPRSHLRLVYEANPLAMLAEQAGGRGWDGRQAVLDITPGALHQRLPLFLGSVEDINEMESYGDVRQEVNPGYEV